MYSYTHGGNAAFEPNSRITLDLSASVNPLGPPAGVGEAIAESAAQCTHYPDSGARELCEGLAALEGVPPEQIFCGAGLSDVIFRLPLCRRERRVLLPAPSFSDYERSAVSAGAEVFFHPLRESDGFAPDGGILVTMRAKKPGMLFFCNPNNPTGILAPRGLMEEILSEARRLDALVVVDECFMDFVGEAAREHSCTPLLGQYRNLVVLKAFTKTFALPGIRLGYALTGDPELVTALRAHGPDWPVSAPANAAALAALRGAEAYLRETARFTAAERERLMDALGRFGFTVFGSRANFVFFKSPYGFDLGRALGERGVRIRDCSNFRGLGPGFYRAAVADRRGCDRLIGALREAMKCQKTS